MGHRDDDELVLSDAELAADERATRAVLARWGEPAPAPPPAALAARAMAAVSGRPARPARRPRTALFPALALLLAPLLALGLWGVLGDSAGPAGLAGGPQNPLGGLLIGLTLAAKPLVNLLLGAGAAGLAAAAVLAVGGWLWWRLVRTAAATEALP